MIALILAAFAVGFGNFAASISIGLSGADRAARFRVGLVFGIFETVMPLIGLLVAGAIPGAPVIGELIPRSDCVLDIR